MTVFKLPDLGEGLTEAEIVAWHVGEGDRVVPDQPLLAVETDKAVVEIPSPVAGRVARLCAGVGDVVAVGATLVAFESGPHADEGSVVGRLPEAAAASSSEAPPAAAAPASPRAKAPPVKALPAVRALAERLGVDLASLAPSGANGVVTREDVERAAGEGLQGESLRGVRRAMALKMAESGRQVVPVTVFDEADVEAWAGSGGVTVRLVRALVAGCRAEPALNAWFDGDAMTLQRHTRIDLGVAMDTGDGLFAPVLRDAGGRDDAAVRAGLDALKAGVGARTIAPETMQGATITLSNFGAFGAGAYATPVVMPPQTAILGAGRIAARVVARDGAACVRRMLALSLTVDHRAVTGGEAARFLAAVIADLEGREPANP